MRDSDKVVIGVRHPQDDVSKREIREQLPVADKQVQPLDVGFARSTLGEHEIAER
jgi:hypothetical protein